MQYAVLCLLDRLWYTETCVQCALMYVRMYILHKCMQHTFIAYINYMHIYTKLYKGVQDAHRQALYSDVMLMW
jgi:hypothetical protein